MLTAKTSNPTQMLRRLKEEMALSMAGWRLGLDGEPEYVGVSPSDHFAVSTSLSPGAVHFDSRVPESRKRTIARYATQQARLVEMLLAGFNQQLLSIEVSAMRVDSVVEARDTDSVRDHSQ